MRPTTRTNELSLHEMLTVDTVGLTRILSCGRATAIEMGLQAEAKIKIGKRTLWNTKKIQAYLDKISVGEQA